MSTGKPPKTTTHVSAIANSTEDTSVRLLKTGTTLTAMAGGISVATIATNTPTRNNDNNQTRGRNRDGYGNLGGSFQLRQTALNAGFNEGTKQGRKDRNKRNGSGFQGQSTYQKATKDYSSRLGDREIYRRYFREAYEHGYADGISGH